MKPKYPILSLILFLFVAVIGWAVWTYSPDINVTEKGSQSVIKSGKPHMKWFRTEKGFHFLLAFDEERFIAHSNSIFFGSIDNGDWVKIKCELVSDSKCTNAELLDFKPGNSHKH